MTTETLTGNIVHDPDSRDHFEVLGMPRSLVVDTERLSKHYYRLSREYHPDFHQTGSAAERLASLRRTAAVNDAYQTLRDPVARGRWWLGFRGGALGSTPQVPTDLAVLVFEVQDVLERARSEQDESVMEEVRASEHMVGVERQKRLDALKRNFTAWDALPEEGSDDALLGELATLLAEISYLTTLARDIGKTLENVSL